MKTIFATMLAQAYDALRGDNLGELRYEDGSVYKFVKYNNGAANTEGTAGDAVGYYAPGGDGASPNGYASNTVTVDLSDTNMPAGILMADCVDTQYVWIQIKGPATVSTTLGGSAGDGNPLVMSADKTLGKAAEADSAAVYKNVCAIADDASAKTVVCNFPF